MTLLERYEAILKMSPISLMNLIDNYNKGLLSDKTRLALEIINGIED
jgi:hypothetical protein